MKLVARKEEMLKNKHKEMEKMQEKVLESYAEVQNIIDRSKREAESSKKYAIQVLSWYAWGKEKMALSPAVGYCFISLKGAGSDIKPLPIALPLAGTLWVLQVSEFGRMHHKIQYLPLRLF